MAIDLKKVRNLGGAEYGNNVVDAHPGRLGRLLPIQLTVLVIPQLL